MMNTELCFRRKLSSSLRSLPHVLRQLRTAPWTSHKNNILFQFLLYSLSKHFIWSHIPSVKSVQWLLINDFMITFPLSTPWMSFISAISNRMIHDLLIDYDHDNVCSIKHQSTQFLFGQQQQQQQLVCNIIPLISQAKTLSYFKQNNKWCTYWLWSWQEVISF